MRRLVAAVVLLLMAAPAGAALPPSMSEGPVSRPQSLSVSVDRTALHVTLGAASASPRRSATCRVGRWAGSSLTSTS